MNALRCMFCALMTIATLAACSASAPLRYYSLDEVAAAGPATHSSSITTLIQVRHISVPSDMDHRGLTHHQSATQLSISDADQWSAPLTDLIQGAMSRNLGERLGFEHILAPAALPVGSQPQATLLRVDLDFVSLSADASCALTAQVNWTVSALNATPHRGSTRLSATSSGCPAGLPAALSEALGDLADQLTPGLSTP